MPSRPDVSFRWAMRHLLTCALVLMLADPNSALASWWLVRSSDGKCLVVDVEPTDKNKNVTKIGKMSINQPIKLKRTPGEFAQKQRPQINPYLTLSSLLIKSDAKSKAVGWKLPTSSS
jgi:hypothetical protein